MLCGIATSLPELVIYRFLQGVAGASMMPLSQGMILDLYEPHEVPHAMSVWSAAIIMGPIIGPTLGGWLTDSLSWRWVFFINLPIGVLAFLGLFTFMSPDKGGHERPFDFLGFGALVLFISAFQLMVDRGPGQDWFGAAEIWVDLGLALGGLYVFIMQTLTAADPFFDRALMGDRNFVTSTIFSFFVGSLLFSSTALLPTMMQNLLGYSVLQSGWANTPRGIGSFFAFLLVPHLVTRFDPRITLSIGLVLSAVGLWMMTRFDLAMTDEPIIISGVFQGFGIGLIFMPLTTLAFATLSPTHRIEGTTVNTLVRTLGSSLGISIVQATYIKQSAVMHENLAEQVQPASPVFQATNPPVFDLSTITGSSLLNNELTRQAAMVAYDDVFLLMLVTTVAVIPLLLIMRPPKAPPGPLTTATAE
jgi:DHA2 family multidrug resistance protein